MNDKISIYGMLIKDTVDGKLAKASQIFDEELNDFQSNINKRIGDSSNCNCEEEITSINNSIVQINNKIKGNTDAIAVLDTNLTNLDNKFEAVDFDTIATLDPTQIGNKFTNIEAEIERIDGSLTNLDNKFEAVDFDTIDNKFTNINGSLETINSNLTTNTNNITELTTKVNANDLKFITLENKIFPAIFTISSVDAANPLSEEDIAKVENCSAIKYIDNNLSYKVYQYFEEIPNNGLVFLNLHIRESQLVISKLMFSYIDSKIKEQTGITIG